MPKLTAMQFTRYETGCGHSLTVTHQITAFYADREPFVSSKMSTMTALVQLQKGGVSQNLASSVLRDGGRLEKDSDGWRLA